MIGLGEAMATVAGTLLTAHGASAAITVLRQRTKRHSTPNSRNQLDRTPQSRSALTDLATAAGEAHSPKPPIIDVTIVRPLKGIEPFSYATLASTFMLDPAPKEILFCIESANDPIVAMVDHIIAAHPHHNAQRLIGRDAFSANPKLNNMRKGWQACTTEWIAFVDSNVLLPQDALRRLFAKWDASTGMVCSPPVGTIAGTFADDLECAFLNAYQARWQSTADAFGYGFAQGKVMLARCETIRRGGGLEALALEPAEDAAATKLVRRQGLRVRLVDRFFEQPLIGRSLHDVWSRQVRWARLRRASFPLHFAAEIATGALPLLVLTTLAAWALDAPIIPIVLAVAAIWYGIELLINRSLDWPSSMLAMLTRDALLPAVWLAGWWSRDFTWHGHDMRAQSGTPTSNKALQT